jgi:hypothetical protein
MQRHKTLIKRMMPLVILAVPISVLALGLAEGPDETPQVKKKAKADTLLLITTSPEGAEIQLNGENVGASGKLLQVDPGTYRLVVDMAGHEPYRQEIEIEDGRITRIELTLKKAPDAAPAPKKTDESEARLLPQTLRYQWKAGKDYLYKANIRVEMGDRVLIMTGNPQYRVTLAEKDRIKLRFSGYLSQRIEMKSGRVPFPSIGLPDELGRSPDFHRFGGGRLPSLRSSLYGYTNSTPVELTIDRRGNIARQQGASPLPLYLGDLSHLMLEVLPPGRESTWTVAKDTRMEIQEKRSDWPPYRSPFDEPTKSYVPAREKIVYTSAGKTTKGVVIRKQFEYAATTACGEKAPFKVSGNGKYTFDTKQGVSTELEFDMTIKLRQGGATVEYPAKVNYRLFSETELAEWKKKRAKALEEAKKKAAELKEQREERQRNGLSEEELEGYVADLLSGDRSRQSKALSELREYGPRKPNREVTAALENVLLKGESSFTRRRAAEALEKWGDKESILVLKKALEDTSSSVQDQAKKAIGEIIGRE